MTDPIDGRDPDSTSSHSHDTDVERRLHALETTIEAIAGLLAQAAELASECAHPPAAPQATARSGPEPAEEHAAIPVPATTRAFPTMAGRGPVPTSADDAQAVTPEPERAPGTTGASSPAAAAAAAAAPTGSPAQAPVHGPVAGPMRGPVPPGAPGVVGPAARAGAMPRPGLMPGGQPMVRNTRQAPPSYPMPPAGMPDRQAASPAAAPGQPSAAREDIASEAEFKAFWNPPTEEEARESRLKAWAREGNIGRHLLSGAAAILVTLAAVSLLIMVWDSIPNVVKIGALGAVALALVAAGTRLGSTKPRLRVTAATLTGTGGVLGFVALIGAEVLHLGIPLLVLMLLMMGWALFLLALSSYSRQFFTAIISTLGALTTMGFVVVRAHNEPASAGMHGTILVVYALLLAGTASLLGTQCTKQVPTPAAGGSKPGTGGAGDSGASGGSAPRLPVAAWYPAMSLVVLAFVLLFDVPSLIRDEQASLWIVLNALTWLAAQAQCLHLGLLLSRSKCRALTGWEWVLDAAITAVPVLKAQIWQDGPTQALLLIMIAARTAIALGLLSGRGDASWRGRCAVGIIPGAIVIALGTPAVSLYLTAPAAILIGAVSIAAARHGWTPAVGLPALAGSALLVLPRENVPTSLCVLLALGLCLAGTLIAERLMRSDGSPRSLSFLRPALAATVFCVIVTLSARVAVLISDFELSATVFQVCATLLSCLLILAGLTSPALTPLALLGFRRFGARGGVDEDGGPTMPSPPPASWIAVLAMWLLALTDLAVSARSDTFLEDALVSVAAVSAGAVAGWLLTPWVGVGAHSLLIAIPDTLIGLGALAILTGSTASSLLMTVAILAIGGLCILVGFRMRATELRHYGLVLVLLAVFKLALVDLSTRSSAMRVVSLAGAGIVCFLLSLAYNRLAEDTAPPQGGAPAGASGPAAGSAEGRASSLGIDPYLPKR